MIRAAVEHVVHAVADEGVGAGQAGTAYSRATGGDKAGQPVVRGVADAAARRAGQQQGLDIGG
jgi:hypothetical protein